MTKKKTDVPVCWQETDEPLWLRKNWWNPSHHNQTAKVPARLNKHSYSPNALLSGPSSLGHLTREEMCLWLLSPKTLQTEGYYVRLDSWSLTKEHLRQHECDQLLLSTPCVFLPHWVLSLLSLRPEIDFLRVVYEETKLLSVRLLHISSPRPNWLPPKLRKSTISFRICHHKTAPINRGPPCSTWGEWMQTDSSG